MNGEALLPILDSILLILYIVIIVRMIVSLLKIVGSKIPPLNWNLPHLFLGFRGYGDYLSFRRDRNPLLILRDRVRERIKETLLMPLQPLLRLRDWYRNRNNNTETNYPLTLRIELKEKDLRGSESIELQSHAVLIIDHVMDNYSRLLKEKDPVPWKYNWIKSNGEYVLRKITDKESLDYIESISQSREIKNQEFNRKLGNIRNKDTQNGINKELISSVKFNQYRDKSNEPYFQLLDKRKNKERIIRCLIPNVNDYNEMTMISHLNYIQRMCQVLERENGNEHDLIEFHSLFTRIRKLLRLMNI